MPETPLYKNLIGGEWVASPTGQTFESRNPADAREIVGIFQDSDERDVEAAVAAASSAYATWRLVPAPKRGEILFRAAQLLVERKEELARTMTREMGKVLSETRGDVQEAIDMAFYMAGEGRRLFGQTTPSEMFDKFQMSVRMPLGVCGLITPWNFPMAIPSWKIFPALILGNTIVLKPASDTPASAYNLVQALVDAGLPPGVVNIVTGSGSRVGEPLIRHPSVKVISFTGSTEIGSRVVRTAAEGMKHVSLEMGGKNPIIVMDDAQLDLAVDGITWGAFGTTGQRCTAASRAIVHRAVAQQLTERLVARAQQLKIGNGLEAGMEVGPVINARQLESVADYVRIGREEGAQLLCGGERLVGGKYEHGFFFGPTIFADVRRDMRIAREEIFGPVLSIITVDSFAEALDVANDVPYGLSSALYTQDVNRAFVAMRELYTGIVYINAPTIGAEIHLPFGGTKGTGNGHRDSGVQALDVFSEWKSIYIDYSGSLQRAQIDNQ